ncbi:TetR/AcrR family transcriptional regulator [Nocardia miyunensis]|uniref:TetR/AcrR family transcriptional regulator n=1 Tax=Nocardia miyunensis TaxID=282684 RepID=UPI000A063871|nr:TetR/AcrR family transcriptional regulator [Nocardia miyunensis]
MTANGTQNTRRTQAERVAESSRRLIDAAIALIAEQGFERTTAAEIGERAGYSRNMVRDRYGSKEAVLEILLETEIAERLLPTLRRERAGTGMDLVLGHVDDLLHGVWTAPENMRAMLVLSFEATAGPIASIRDWYAKLIPRFQAEMAENIALGQRDGSIRADLDAQREAETYVSYGIGLCFRWVMFREGFDLPAEITAWRARLARDYTAT